MVKYVTTALALKCFSSSSWTRGLYRSLGNTVGNRRRSSGAMPAYYVERIKRMLRLQRRYNIVKNGDRILELGTGWLHWEAIAIRLFWDIEAILFDVWDNRQLMGLKNYVRQLGQMLSNGFELSGEELSRAQSIIETILKVRSFNELYKLLGFEYIVDSSGSLRQFQNDSFRLVVSGGVLEHVKADAIPELIGQMRRIIEPGGWALHSIDTADHLEHYDRTVSPKLYLSLSERVWKRLFENEVQYINRVQRGEWMGMFRSNEFEVIDEESHRIDIGRLKVTEKYTHMEKQDLECTVLKIALRKPAPAVAAHL